ncbi:MAG: hypothetical protein M3Y32_06970 [Pseudomonadota bacterium]|nr:hypothetical protein [Pseudomonadota bacterium]
MLRVIVILVLLANAAFFGWAQGWLDPFWPAPRAAEHEPARSKAQVRPEAVTVSRPGAAASSATP